LIFPLLLLRPFRVLNHSIQIIIPKRLLMGNGLFYKIGVSVLWLVVVENNTNTEFANHQKMEEKYVLDPTCLKDLVTNKTARSLAPKIALKKNWLL